jgi:hypothetical protein
MNTLTPHCECNIDTVVDEKRHTELFRDGVDLFSQGNECGCREFLFTQLHDRHTAFDGGTDMLWESCSRWE